MFTFFCTYVCRCVCVCVQQQCKTEEVNKLQYKQKSKIFTFRLLVNLFSIYYIPGIITNTRRKYEWVSNCIISN